MKSGAEDVISIIAEKLAHDPDKVSLKSDLVLDLQADSLDCVEIMMTFEEKYGIVVPDEDFEKIRTVNDVVNYLDAKGVL